MDPGLRDLMLTYDRLRAVRLPVRCSMSSLMMAGTVEQASAIDLASTLAAMLVKDAIFARTRLAHARLSGPCLLAPQTALKALAVDAVRADILAHGAPLVAEGLQTVEEEAGVAPGTFAATDALAARIRADRARLDAEELAARRALEAVRARREDLSAWEETLRGVERFREIAGGPPRVGC